jgi:cellobiose phosphorylase
MYQAAIEGLLGLRREGATFSVNPCVPAMWPSYAVDWRFGRTLYHIVVTNPEHRCRGVQSAELDGAPIDPSAIPLRDDGATHDVAVVLGKPGAVGVSAEAASKNARSVP